MCELLDIPRSVYYYHPKEKKIQTSFENAVIQCFKDSRNNYGTRKIKKELQKGGITLSRKKIAAIMKEYKLISNYTIKNFKVHHNKVNEKKVENIVDRQFDSREDLEVLVSDLTYVRVNKTKINILGKFQKQYVTNKKHKKAIQKVSIAFCCVTSLLLVQRCL